MLSAVLTVAILTLFFVTVYYYPISCLAKKLTRTQGIGGDKELIILLLVRAKGHGEVV